jgi:hypothetical protein
MTIMTSRHEILGVWGATNMRRYSLSDLEALSLAEDDSRLLCEVGLPCWAAPNIYFGMPEPCAGRPAVKIGEDKYDRAILLLRPGGRVVVERGPGACGLMEMHDGVAQMVEVLLLYADMVERSLRADGRNASISNRIPDELIDWFAERVSAISPGLVRPDTFWHEEISRLRSHVPD